MDTMTEETQKLFEELTKQNNPPQRGLLAGPPTEAEVEMDKQRATRLGLIQTLQIIIQTLPYVHPDWLMPHINELQEPEVATIARLQFLQRALASSAEVYNLQRALVAAQKKYLADQGIEVPAEEGRFTLDTVLQELASRISGGVARR